MSVTLWTPFRFDTAALSRRQLPFFLTLRTGRYFRTLLLENLDFLVAAESPRPFKPSLISALVPSNRHSVRSFPFVLRFLKYKTLPLPEPHRHLCAHSSHPVGSVPPLIPWCFDVHKYSLGFSLSFAPKDTPQGELIGRRSV